MKRLKYLFFIILIPTITLGQKVKQNNIYFELGGNGLFLSLNYEKPINKKGNLLGHAGLGLYGIKPSYLTIPFGINYFLYNKTKNYFVEFGLGSTYSKADVKLYATVENRNNTPPKIQAFNIIPSVAIRTNAKHNLVYKVSFSVVFNQYEGLPFAGFTIGKSF